MRLFLKENTRSLAIESNGQVLVFKNTPQTLGSARGGSGSGSGDDSETDLNNPTILAELVDEEYLFHEGYFEVSNTLFHGLLGVITLNGYVFIGLITSVIKVGTVRWDEQGNPLENIYKIISVDFYCLNSSQFDHWLLERNDATQEKLTHEHPCGRLKKMFSDGSFYYSRGFDITNVLQDRGIVHSMDFVMVNYQEKFVWNNIMMNEIIQFRNRITTLQKPMFDGGHFMTLVIRGYANTLMTSEVSGLQTSITLISRVSTENKEKIFDLHGVDEEGNVSSLIESEVMMFNSQYMLSYTQVRGNVPISWEAVDSKLHGKKVRITRSPELSQISFDKHFDALIAKYGVISIVNIMKEKKSAQEMLSTFYKECAMRKDIKFTDADFSSDTLKRSAHKLNYLLKDDIFDYGAYCFDNSSGYSVGKQTGVFRYNTFDNLDKPNLAQKSVSIDVLEQATQEVGLVLGSDFVNKHGTLWDDNGYSLTKIQTKNAKSRHKRKYAVLFDDRSRVSLFDPLSAYIKDELDKRILEFSSPKDISIFTGTFNVNGKLYKEDLSSWLFPADAGVDLADIYLIGIEEIVELTPGHMLTIDPTAKHHWEVQIMKHLNSRSRYVQAWSAQMGGIALLMYVREKESSNVRFIEGDVKKTGFRGISANKGAVAVSFVYSTTTFCVVVSHLAAGLENNEQRHNDYKRISKSINFARNHSIKDHDAVLWMGDFNYRILASNEDVRKLILQKDYNALFHRDQLNQQMSAGESFPFYNEKEINFPPTYKFNPGTRVYDTSEKMRIPAWTDRILTRGSLLKQLSYGCSEDIIFSDHRPVYATFLANVVVVNEAMKVSLTKDIYEQVKLNKLQGYDVVSDRLGQQQLGDKVHSKYASKSKSKLPPPSSDAKKWWIEDGRSVKVALDISPDAVMNPHRPVNPFEFSDEPDFVEGEY